MKKLVLPSLLLFALYTTLSSCNKDTQITKTIMDTLTVKDTVTVTPTPSILSLLTGKQWILDSLYTSYTGPGTGTLAYVRGGGNNLLDMDKAVGYYWPDGTQQFFDQYGNPYPGRWTITNIDSTHLIYVDSAGGGHCQILRLDATHFNVFDSTNEALDIEVYKP